MNPMKITQWTAFLRRNQLTVDGASFGDIVVTLSTFLLPPMQALAQGIPFSQHWAAGTQWHRNSYEIVKITRNDSAAPSEPCIMPV